MLKKALFVVGGLGLLGTLFFGRDCASYIGTSIGWARQSISENVPIGFQIDRAREMCDKLDKPIERNMHLIAKEEVAAERLAKEIERAEAKINKEESDMLKLRTDLSDGQQFYVYAGRKYTKKQVETDLTRRLARFKTNRETLDSLRQTHQARLRGLDAARLKLAEMQAAQRQLQVDVENLAARQKMVEVAQTASDINVDDSRLGRAKELVGELRTRLEVAERIVNAEGTYQGEIPLDDAQAEDIVDAVGAYFEDAHLPTEEIAGLSR